MFLDPDKKINRHKVNLPHWQQGEVWIFVTWRLADSLPKNVVSRLNEEREIWLKKHPKPWNEETYKEHNRLFTLGFEKLLDQAHGDCLLKNPVTRQIVSDSLLHFQDERYQLNSFVIMPNHVHVLFRPQVNHKLDEILQSWKRHSARKINQSTGKSGSLWQREYWDRLIRSEVHMDWVRNYILKNPTHIKADEYTLWQHGEGFFKPF